MTIRISQLDQLESKISDLKAYMESLIEEFREAKETTDKFLSLAAEAGCTRVGICERLPEIPWPFGPGTSVFGNGDARAIWRPVYAMSISGGCANSNQSQIDLNAALIEGIYELKEGKWYRETEDR